MKQRGHIILLALVILAGLVIRLEGLTEKSLWYDEAVSLWASQGRLEMEMLKSEERVAKAQALIDLPFMPHAAAVLLSNLASMDSPPGYPLVMSWWLAATGTGEWALRFPACLFSAAAIGAIYLLARQFLAPGPALFSAALAAASVAQVFWARENREYSASVLFAALYLASAAHYLRHPDKRALWHVAVVGALSVWVHYSLLLLMIPVSGYVCFAHADLRKRWLRGQWLVGVSFLCVTIVALGPQLYFHNTGSGGHLSVLYSDGTLAGMFHYALKKTLQFPAYALTAPVWRPQPWLWFCMLAACFGLGCAWRSPKGRLAFWWCLLPMALTLVLALVGRYPYGPTRHCLFLTPMIYVVFGFAAQALLNRLSEKPRFAVVAVLAVLLLAAGAYGPHSPAYLRQPWRHAREVAAHLKEHRQPEETVFANGLFFPPLEYYAPIQKFNLRNLRINASTDEEALREMLQKTLSDPPPTFWLVMGHLPQAQQARVLEWLNETFLVEDTWQMEAVRACRITTRR
jgi:uncharacterized membrane protein